MMKKLNVGLIGCGGRMKRHIEALLQMEDIGGLVINPFGEAIFLDKEDITVILNPGVERFM